MRSTNRGRSTRDLESEDRPSGASFIVADGQGASFSDLELEAKIGLDLKDEMKLRVNLASQDDALYVGSLYLGAPSG